MKNKPNNSEAPVFFDIDDALKIVVPFVTHVVKSEVGFSEIHYLDDVGQEWILRFQTKKKETP